MKNIKAVLLGAFLLTAQISRADIVTDFIKNLLSGNESGMDGFWNNPEYENQPNGGYLFKCKLKLPSGKDVVLLASSLTAKKAAITWDAYLQNSDATYRKLGAEIIMSPARGVYCSKSGGKYQLNTVIVTPPASVSVYSYIFNGDSITSSKRELSKEDSVLFINDDSAPNKLGIGEKTPLEIRKVLLAEFLNSSEPKWRPYQPELTILGQAKDTADAQALKLTKRFSMSDAQSLINGKK